jgi:hypothetical protein
MALLPPPGSVSGLNAVLKEMIDSRLVDGASRSRRVAAERSPPSPLAACRTPVEPPRPRQEDRSRGLWDGEKDSGSDGRQGLGQAREEQPSEGRVCGRRVDGRGRRGRRGRRVADWHLVSRGTSRRALQVQGDQSLERPWTEQPLDENLEVSEETWRLVSPRVGWSPPKPSNPSALRPGTSLQWSWTLQDDNRQSGVIAGAWERPWRREIIIKTLGRKRDLVKSNRVFALKWFGQKNKESTKGQ